MANRFPLIVDADTNQIKEIPAGDNLDFSSTGIANLTSLSVGGTISAVSMTTSGNATISGTATISGAATISGNTSVGGTLAITGATTAAGITATGTVDAANFTVSGNPLSSIQVQSDWAVTDTNSAAFIKNKPSLSITVNNLTDIGDVFFDLRDGGSPGDAGYVGDVLTWDGFSWSNKEPTGGISLTDLNIGPTGTPSGQGSLGYDNTTGIFTYTPPTIAGLGGATAAQGLLADSAVQPGDSLSDLSNVSTRFVAYTDVQVSDPITITPISGNSFAIGFNNALPGAGFLTAESDTLATVTGRGALTTTAITVPAITANNAGTPSVFQNLEALGITVGATGISSTNGGISFTNGNITATNGTVTGATITGTNQVNTTGFMSTPLISNTAGDFTLQANATGRVQITQGYFKLPNNASRPGTGETGDFHWNGQVLEMYTADDGGGNASWLHITGDGGAAQRGFIIPNFTTTERNALTPAPGEMILNSTTGNLDVYTGPTFGWRSVALS